MRAHYQSLEQAGIGLSERLLEGWIRALHEPGAATGSRPALSLASRLRALRDPLLGALRARWRELLEPVDRVAAALTPPLEWALIDEDQAERDIEISRLVQLVELQAEAELRELQGIVIQLLPSGQNYPWLPLPLARSLSAALQSQDLEVAQRALLMRLALPLFAGEIKGLYARCIDQLRKAGAPEPRYRASAAPSAVAARAERESGSLARLRDRASVPTAPDSLSDLGTRLSEQMLRDPRLDEATRRALRRLQPRLSELAAVDGELLAREDHPAWTLIEEIADHAAELPTQTSSHHATFVAFLEALLDRLEQSGRRADFETAVGELQAFVATDHHLLVEESAPQIQALTEAEKERELLPLLRQQLELQLGRSQPLPPSLHQFLLGPWTKVVCHAMVHLGEEDPETQELMGVVDELQLSLQRPRDEVDRQMLVKGLPGLLQRLQRGMALIELPQAERDKVLDGLMEAHRRLLFSPAKPAPEPAPESGPDTDLLAEALWDDEHPDDHWVGGAGLGVSDTNLGSLPTVPMGLDEGNAERQAAAWLDALPIGVRCKIFLHAQWTTAHLIWRSDNGQFFMFSSALASGSHSMTRRAIERLRTEGLVTDVAKPGLLRRAVAGLLQEDGLA